MKIGKRFEKFGLFGKVRPGFLSVNRVVSLLPGPAGLNNELNFKIERETFFTIDGGGVLELYPSRRSVVRFEAGDTAIRHPGRFGQISLLGPVELIRPAKFKHNFQFTAGVAFRLGDFPGDQPAIKTSGLREPTKRFEVGAQFTSILVDPGELPSLTFPRLHSEPGLGGRLTFNLSSVVAFEAEGNYFTRPQFGLVGGHIFQAQFGGKVGKRFEKWGLFGKARPGFVGFSRALDLDSLPVGANQFASKLYPSLDVGGVVESYICPRWMARFDVGDTLIRYSELVLPNFSPPFVLQRRETRHNFQVGTGIGFRF